jgi:hypothetical protein
MAAPYALVSIEFIEDMLKLSEARLGIHSLTFDPSSGFVRIEFFGEAAKRFAEEAGEEAPRLRIQYLTEPTELQARPRPVVSVLKAS